MSTRSTTLTAVESKDHVAVVGDRGAAIEIRRAGTAEQRAAVQSFRYTVYVEELGRYRSSADHVTRRFAEPEDDHSWHFVAVSDGEIIAATRLTWGGDGFSDRQVEQYGLAPFLDELPATVMAVGERTMTAAAYRGTSVVAELLAAAGETVAHHGIRLLLGACEPHLLPLYLEMGQRPYADRNINSAEAGLLVPLATCVPDAAALVGHGSGPIDVTAAALPSCIERLLDGSGTVSSPFLSSPKHYLAELEAALDGARLDGLSPFEGFSHEETQICLSRSTMIRCNAGDRLLKQGGSAHNAFVVLAGSFQVHDGEHVLATLHPGDLLGETALLLEQPRGFDVDAVTDGRVLSLSAGTFRAMLQSEPVVAAKLLLNMSKTLCTRLAEANRSRQ